VLVVVGASVAAWRSGWFAPAQPFRELASARGSRTTITLRDGSRLVLGPATRVRVPGDFGVSTRTVELDGEALFAVVHDARRPFAVRTARTVVRDVGTTFAVTAYADDACERVAVVEGEVALQGVALHANDMATVDSAGRLAVRRAVDVTAYTGWTQGGLVFKDTPLGEAMRDLARTFDLDVTIADSELAVKLVTGSFRDQPADEVLSAITHVVGAHYERTGRTVVIRRGALPVGRPAPAGIAPQRLTRAGTTSALTLSEHGR
jgi:ferric-dicitrate binding protein FerR (iron transport regulator)